MENTNEILRNYKVELIYFIQNNGAYVQCNVSFHLQAISVHQALFFAVMKLQGVPLEDIEDVKIEREL